MNRGEAQFFFHGLKIQFDSVRNAALEDEFRHGFLEFHGLADVTAKTHPHETSVPRDRVMFSGWLPIISTRMRWNWMVRIA